MPIEKLVATSFGRVVRGISLNPTEVNSIGILLGDKKPGPFQLAIRSIEVVRGTN
ncbi:MAG: CIA30 family protein [Rubripirellula sp.]